MSTRLVKTRKAVIVTGTGEINLMKNVQCLRIVQPRLQENIY
jgi:hypothetical protein